MTSRLRGFTLIELLIVVAIIAILAAIAVPNFLEAQTRAKSSRVKSDIRTLATALEAYAVDHNKYPPHLFDSGTEVPYPDRYVYLTTPVAFITSIPARDPFYQFYETTAGSGGEWISYTNFASFPTTNAASAFAPTHRWLLRSRAPDGVSEANSERNAFMSGGIAAAPAWLYDATNGTISRGDICRTSKFNFQ